MNMPTMTLQRPRLDEDVVPYTECRQTLADCMARTRRTHRPVLITQNGRAATVMMDVSDFENAWDTWDMMRERSQLTESVGLSRKQFERGEFISHKDGMAKIRKMLNERRFA